MRWLFFIGIVLVCLPLPGMAAGEVLAVIVPQGEAGRSVNAQELALIFKRKKLNWDDASRIHPVNLAADHPWRRLFSQRVLKSLPEAQAQYWNNLYYHGIFPPHVVASPEAMLRYVAETPGAIGYADACGLDDRVRAVLWIKPSGGISSVPLHGDCAAD